MRRRSLTAYLLSMSVTSMAMEIEYWGVFKGDVVARWRADGRTMELFNDVEYTDPDGVVWIAPRGAVIDGASIPRLLWTLIGGPFEGVYRDASVVHDVACATKSRSWEATHLAFYRAMRASGVPSEDALLMYYAVYWFGPRWRQTIQVFNSTLELTKDLERIARSLNDKGIVGVEIRTASALTRDASATDFKPARSRLGVDDDLSSLLKTIGSTPVSNGSTPITPSRVKSDLLITIDPERVSDEITKAEIDRARNAIKKGVVTAESIQRRRFAQ